MAEMMDGGADAARFRASYLVRGFPGHPLHPPLTDATIGIYTLASILGLLGALGVSEASMSKGWWLALVVGLATTAPTALTGLVDWLSLTSGTPLWRTATSHMVAMLTATVFFGLAAILGHRGYAHGDVNGSGLALTLVGFAVLTVGGWLGGSIVYVHGMRVLNLVDEPSLRAVASPLAPEKEEAESA
jgi:uncharacterized membrane protein